MTGSEFAGIVFVLVVGVTVFALQNRTEGRRAVTESCGARHHDRCVGTIRHDDGSTTDCGCHCHQPAQLQPPFL